MAINRRPPRSVSSIKTHSGRGSGTHEAHRDYFKVGALELERSRRVKERDAANNRIAIINARISEIDSEKTALLAAASAASACDDKSDSTKKEPSGLRIKY
jgi:hypothetical protein